MTPKLMVSLDTVQLNFVDEPADRVEIFDIVADYDLEGNPIGFEAFDFKSPPFGEKARIESNGITASFVSEDNALSVWFLKEPRSGNQEELDAEFGFSDKGILVFVKYKYHRGAAAKSHREARGWENTGQ